MPYDQSLDQQIFKEVKDFEDTRISIGVFSYNGGEKKMQVVRENQDSTGNWRFTKLGRLSKAELEQILPLIQQAYAQM